MLAAAVTPGTVTAQRRRDSGGDDGAVDAGGGSEGADGGDGRGRVAGDSVTGDGGGRAADVGCGGEDAAGSGSCDDGALSGAARGGGDVAVMVALPTRRADGGGEGGGGHGCVVGGTDGLHAMSSWPRWRRGSCQGTDSGEGGAAVSSRPPPCGAWGTPVAQWPAGPQGQTPLVWSRSCGRVEGGWGGCGIWEGLLEATGLSRL